MTSNRWLSLTLAGPIAFTIWMLVYWGNPHRILTTREGNVVLTLFLISLLWCGIWLCIGVRRKWYHR
jgi:hypothetical protein